MWGREKPKEKQGSSSNNVPKIKTTQAIETTIGPNTHIKGDVQGDGGLRIEGVIEGNVEITGNLVVTESAKVLAEVKANNISIAGAIRGNVHANRVEILETGRVWGDLNIKSLLINEGAYLSGQTIMPQDLKPPTLESDKPKISAPPKLPEKGKGAGEEKKS
jgi:cytoskeletal protein CcmA (bactofilin family)